MITRTSGKVRAFYAILVKLVKTEKLVITQVRKVILENLVEQENLESLVRLVSLVILVKLAKLTRVTQLQQINNCPEPSCPEPSCPGPNGPGARFSGEPERRGCRVVARLQSC